MKQEKITFQNSKGQKLVGVLYNPNSKGRFPIVIYCHGYRSTKESGKVKPLAEKLTSKNISLFAFDFSGRGESDGKFEDTTITQYIDDLKYAIGHISKLTDKLGIIGNSLGGLVSLQETAKNKRIKVLALLSPVSYFPTKKKNGFTPNNIKEWKKKRYTFTKSERFGKMKINYSYYKDGLKYGNYSVYEDIKIPVLIIHGTNDESVPISYSEKLIKHIKNHKFIALKRADHNYTKKKDFDKVIDETSKFIKEILK